MSATTTPETPETELTPELIDRVRKLSPENRDRLIALLGGSPAVPDSPPNSDADWEYWKAEIQRRVAAVKNGTMKTYTLDEAMAKIRAAREARGE